VLDCRLVVTSVWQSLTLGNPQALVQTSTGFVRDRRLLIVSVEPAAALIGSEIARAVVAVRARVTYLK